MAEPTNTLTLIRFKLRGSSEIYERICLTKHRAETRQELWDTGRLVWMNETLLETEEE